MSKQPASLPNGFRDSTGEATLRPDLGPLPEEWQVVRLGEVIEDISSGDWGNEFPESSELPAYVLRGTDFARAACDDFAKIPIRYLKPASLDKRKLDAGNILVELSGGSKDQPTGRVLLVTNHFLKKLDLSLTFSNFVKRLHIKTCCEPEFFALYWQSLYEKGVTRIYEKRTTGIRNFKLIDFLNNESLFLPPLPEQRAIAHVLTSIQRAIEATEQVIAAARELKKALMRHLFTYGPVPPAEAESVPLQETEIGPLPVHWRVVRLGEISEVKYGKANPNDSGSIPIVGSGGIFANTSTPLVTHPTLVIGRKGTAGKVWLFLSPCYPSDTTFYLHWKKEIDVSFVFYFLNLRPLSGEHAKTTLPSLQKPYLENTSVPLPPLPEQRAIAEMLGAVDEKIQAEERRKAALQSLFRSMLHYLMTGKVRVAGLVTPPTQPEE